MPGALPIYRAVLNRTGRLGRQTVQGVAKARHRRHHRLSFPRSPQGDIIA
jgi:hypothetical protein